MEQKKDRFEKIALESSKQSKRTLIPEVEGLIKISEIKSTSNYLSLMFYENKKESFKSFLPNSENKDISIFIRLEGGLSEDNMQGLGSRGFRSVSLGNRTLCADTASICALSIIQYELGDIE